MERKTFIGVLAGLPLLNSLFTEAVSGKTVAPPCKTGRDAEGPFYKSNAPLRTVIEIRGVPLHIEGKVLAGGDCKTPVANAIVDVWHCDNHGDYDMEGYTGRGRVRTAPDGSYRFTTIFPPPYGNRPRHIHFKIRAQGKPEFTTQLYFEGDPFIQNDFARNAEKDRVIPLDSDGHSKKGVFNIYL